MIINKAILEPTFKTISFEQLKSLSLTEQLKCYTSRIRRTISRSFSPYLNTVIKNILKKQLPKVRSRNLVILADLVGCNSL